jgi:hypothetical protein
MSLISSIMPLIASDYASNFSCLFIASINFCVFYYFRYHFAGNAFSRSPQVRQAYILLCATKAERPSSLGGVGSFTPIQCSASLSSLFGFSNF